jgi:hypothetical protein
MKARVIGPPIVSAALMIAVMRLKAALARHD